MTEKKDKNKVTKLTDEKVPAKPQINPEDLQKLLMSQMQNAGAAKKAPNQQSANKKPILARVNDFMQSVIKWLDWLIKYVTNAHSVKEDDVMHTTRPPIMFGFIVIFIVLGIGGSWSVFAPLNSAAHAQGKVMPSSRKQYVQHLHPGIVTNIFVEKGQEVQAGDPIIELDDTEVKAEFATLKEQYLLFLATRDRLHAERDNLREVKYSEMILEEKDDEEIANIIDNQEKIFENKKNLYNTQIDVKNEQINQLKERLNGLESQRIANLKRLTISKDKLDTALNLQKQGFIHKEQIQEIESQIAALEGQDGELISNIAATKQKISESKLEIAHIQNDRLHRLSEELKETNLRVVDAKEKFNAVKTRLGRVVLRSPVDGVVNEIYVTTIGGVTPNPGQPLAEITPVKDQLVVDAMVNPNDIASIKLGQISKIKFLAYKSRTSPSFDGTVVFVAPDVVAQQGPNGQSMESYSVRIEVDQEQFEKFAKQQKTKLQPGMLADVQIITGERTLLRYLLDPLTDNMRRAFSEK